MTQLSLYLLGAFQATLDDKTITAFATDKARALLAYLAVEADRPHRRDDLAELLWPDQLQHKARQNLRQALSYLRKAIGDLECDVPFLSISRETVQINPASDFWLDVTVLTNLIKASQTHRHRQLVTCRPCRERLEQAIELYQGGFLEQFYLGDSADFEEWTLLKREWLYLLAAEALSSLTDCYERRGAYERARRYAWRRVELEPWREEAHRQLMRLLALQGQRSAALAQYETCRRTLAEELGVEPMTETTALYERIREGQLVPPLEPVHSLPPPPTPFVGREAELAELAELLADPDCRLLTLLGPGGIGKTRLALQVAEEQVGAFAHGVHFVPLASVSSTEFLLPALGNALGFSFQGRRDPQEQLCDYLREKEMLLVLDSMEHLLQGREMLTTILQRAPGVVLLVTLRERLNLHKERVYEVGGLKYPENGATSGLEDCSAVKLFVQSAQRAYQDLALSEGETTHVLRVCQLVEGMPLGLELAAAWVAVRSVQEIAQEIAGNLDVLSSVLRNVPERHRSIRATFEYSWGLLAKPECRALARLSVFHGGFQAEAAGQVAGASPSGLAALADKSLLRQDVSGRYEMHGLLRQYAADKLEDVYREQTETRDQHCDYYATFLQRQERALRGGEQRHTLESIGKEIKNVRVAWKWAVSQPLHRALDKSMESLRLFYDMRSWFQEAKEAFGRAAEVLAAAGRSDTEDQRRLGRVLARYGGFCFRLGFYEEARELFQKSITIFRDFDEEIELASALVGLGHVAHYQRGRDEAQRCYEESLALNRASGNARGTAEALNSLGVVLRVQGRYTQAKQALDEALAIGRRLEDHWRAAFFLNNLGIVSRMMGEYQKARAYYKESLALKRRFGDSRGVAISLNNLGNILYALEELEEAERLHRESMAICQEIGDLQGVARSLNNLGMTAHAQKKYAAAQQLHQQSLTIKQEIGDQRGMVHSFSHLGKAAAGLGAYQPARQDFCRALKIAMELDAIPLALFALQGMAELLAKEGRPERAVELIALICFHPASEQWTKDQAANLLTKLEAALSPQQRTTAEERGKKHELKAVVAEILCEGIKE